MAEALTLGDVTFNDFEIPEHFSIGGKQNLIIHTLPNGGRVVDTMGPDDAPIQWSGVFTGIIAGSRVKILENMRRDGRPRLMTYASWRYNVVVREFTATVTGNQWIPYQIQLCIVQHLSDQSNDLMQRAQCPFLTVELQDTMSVKAALAAAELGLASTDIKQAMAAAGSLAQYTTAQIYGLVSE